MCACAKLLLQCAFPFKQGRMRIIEAAVERVRDEIVQVLFAQFAQCMNKRLRLSHCRTRECVRLVFKTARPGVNKGRKPETYGPCQQRKQQHRRDDTRSGKASLMLETKRAIKPLLTRQPRNRGERHEDASNGNPEQLHYVALFVMANLVREHGFQFRLGEMRDKCVEQDDFSNTPEPG